jgi:TonB family protein
MLKKVLILAILAGFIQTQLYSEAKSQSYIKGNQIGYLLLNDLIITFENYNPNVSKKDWKDKVFDSLRIMLNKAKEAKEKKDVDSVFYTRFKRVIHVLQLSFLVREKKNSAVLNKIIFDQISEFDNTRDKPRKNEIDSVSSIASAIAEEVLSLKKHLDFIYDKKNILFLEHSDLPRIIKMVKPKLPPLTAQAMIAGRKVILEVLINERGDVAEAVVVSSKYPKLNRSMVAAVMLFKFEPYVLNGVARSVRFNLSISYN